MTKRYKTKTKKLKKRNFSTARGEETAALVLPQEPRLFGSEDIDPTSETYLGIKRYWASN